MRDALFSLARHTSRPSAPPPVSTTSRRACGRPVACSAPGRFPTPNLPLASAGRRRPAPRSRTVSNRRATSPTRYCDPARRPGRAHGRPPRRHHPTRTPHPPTSRLNQPSWDHCSHIGIASLSIQSRRVGIPPDVLRAFSYPPSVNRDAGMGGRFEGKERSTLSSGSSSSQRASPEMTADEICSQLPRLAGPLAE